MYLLTLSSSYCFFFNDTATTEIYTLSLHDALPISKDDATFEAALAQAGIETVKIGQAIEGTEVAIKNNADRSEEHTSELQSRENLVCRLLLEKKKKKKK